MVHHMVLAVFHAKSVRYDVDLSQKSHVVLFRLLSYFCVESFLLNLAVVEVLEYFFEGLGLFLG